MPGLIKIGHTKMPLNDRLSQLNSTGVPVPFEIGASFFVNNPQKCETEIHRLLNSYRISKEREFFELSLYDAVNATIKVVQQFAFDSEELSNNLKPSSSFLDLSSLEISILQFLAGDMRKYGHLTWQIHNVFRETDALDVEYMLACLKEHGLVEERREREHHDNNWKITSKGIKYLFDSGIM
jgi:hypothetical protein